MWFEGRWRASGWDLLGSRFQRRSLQRRRPRDTPLPPPWNLSFLLWWGHVLSVNWCVFFLVFFAFVSNNHLLPQEMMYVWNGFTIVGKKPELTEGILSTLEKAEEQLRNDPSEENFLINGCFLILTQGLQFTVWCADPSEYHTGDECVVQLLKGLCLRSLGRLVQAEICFNHVISRWACLDVTAIHQKHSSGSLLKVLSRNFYFNNPFNRLLFQELICLMSHLGSSATNQHWGWIGGESRLIRMTVNQWQNGRCADALMHK